MYRRQYGKHSGCLQPAFHRHSFGRFHRPINNTYSGSVTRLARLILCEAIFNTAPGQLMILGYDGELSGIFAPFAALSAGESRILDFVNDEKQLAVQA